MPPGAAEHTDLVLVGVLAAVAALLVIGQAVRVPYPILLVIGGLLVGFVPGVPHVELEPKLVLTIILPPLLYSAAFFSSLRDLRAALRPISALSIGLVLATTLAVAAVAHLALGLPWPVAFVLGAIVSPTDAVAATAIASRFGIPRRIVTVIEGESLINDATALVVYRFAVAAVVASAFSLPEALLRFAVNAAGGVAIGLAVGWVVANVRKRIENPPVENSISLFTSYFAYLPADALGVSGILAAVTVGIYMGWRAPEVASPATRLQGFPVWEILVFVLNSALFILIGLQLPRIVERLAGLPALTLIGYGALVSAVVIAVRIVWVLASDQGLPRFRRRRPSTRWQDSAVVAWSGMRGAISLAAALALPISTAGGTPFPHRELIVFLVFSVILATLLVQGLTLPRLICRLRVEEDGTSEREESKARLKAAKAAIARIDELAAEDWVRDETAERMRGAYEYRLNRFRARFDDSDDGGYEEQSVAYQRLRREVLEAERGMIVRLRRQGVINDEVMHRIERDLDLEDSRLEI